MEESNVYALQTSSNQENGLEGANALTYRALVIAEEGYVTGLVSGLSIFDDSTDTNLTVNVSAAEDLSFAALGDGMTKAVVQSSVPYTIARTQGHITVVFGYDSEVVPEISLTGGLAKCDYYYADPTRDLIIDQDGKGSGITTQTGDKAKKQMPIKIVTHLVAAAAGYLAASSSQSSEV